MIEKEATQQFYRYYYEGLSALRPEHLDEVTMLVTSEDIPNRATVRNDTIPTFQKDAPILSFPLHSDEQSGGIPSKNVARFQFQEPGIDAPELLQPGTNLYLQSISYNAILELTKDTNQQGYRERLDIFMRRNFTELVDLMERFGLESSVMGLVTHRKMRRYLQKTFPLMDFSGDRVHTFPVRDDLQTEIAESIARQLEMTANYYPEDEFDLKIVLIKGTDLAEMVRD